MRNVAIATVLLFLGIATVIGLSGCREESGNRSFRKARLVGNENIELKKQLKQRDKEIKRQKQLVVQCRAEQAKDKELSGDNLIKMRQHLAESGKQGSALKAENTQLKQRDKEIKRQKQLVGNENIELKKQLKQRDKEIKRQKQRVGNENIELKKQLEQRDREIKRQKQRVVQYRANPTKDQELAANNLIKLLQHLADSAKQVKALTAENTQLKEKIKELEAR